MSQSEHASPYFVRADDDPDSGIGARRSRGPRPSRFRASGAGSAGSDQPSCGKLDPKPAEAAADGDSLDRRAEAGVRRIAHRVQVRAPLGHARARCATDDAGYGCATQTLHQPLAATVEYWGGFVPGITKMAHGAQPSTSSAVL